MKLLASLLVLLLAITGTFGCGSSARWSVASEVSVGQQSCRVLTVPSDWKPPPQHGHLWPFSINLSYFGYELRQSKDNLTLYLGMYFPGGGDLATGSSERFYSENKFALKPGASSMRAASGEEWQAAVPFQFTNGSLISDQKDEIVYRGRVFPKKTPRAYAVPSKTYKWATVFSFAYPPVSNPAQKEYTLYFEIFDLAAGQLMISGEAKFAGVGMELNRRSDGLPARTGWYDDKYFVMPLENKKRKFLLCSMP
jgi:hypothetical protein